MITDAVILNKIIIKLCLLHGLAYTINKKIGNLRTLTIKIVLKSNKFKYVDTHLFTHGTIQWYVF